MKKIDWSELRYDLYKFRSKFTIPVRNFFHWIIKSCQYAWMLRHDRDWDWVYICDVLKYKIERTRKHIAKHHNHTRADEDCHNMRVAEILLDRITNDNYCEVEWDQHYDKWGGYNWDSSTLERKNAKTPQQKEQERTEFLRIAKHETYMQGQDMTYLFKHLRKYLKHWWD